MQRIITGKKGFGIIEIVIALAMVVIVVTGVAKAIALVYRAYNATELKTQALTYVQQPIEIISGLKNELFVCSCNTDSCTSGVCTRSADGQRCDLIGIYTSCWTSDPVGLAGNSIFYLEKTLTVWQLKALTAGNKEVITADPRFSREIIIENLFRDAAGDISSSGTVDPNTKKITAKVYWTERGASKSVSLSTIFTAWENL